MLPGGIMQVGSGVFVPAVNVPTGNITTVAAAAWKDQSPFQNNYGKLSSTVVTLVTNPNQSPVVTIAPVAPVVLPNTTTITATVSDDGRPNPPGKLTATWSVLSGPGNVLVGTASSTIATNGNPTTATVSTTFQFT